MNMFVDFYNDTDRKNFSTLKDSINKEKQAALKLRLKQKPFMSDLEYLLGAFLEMYEPYLKEIVCKLSERGYAIETSSGFGSNDSEYQSLDGHFSVDYVTKNRLEKNDIKVRDVHGYRSLVFLAEKIDLGYITQKWLRIIDLLPDKGALSSYSISPKAIQFRRKYASKNPFLQRQRLFERLENSIRLSMNADIQKRKTSNPNPNKLESNLGIFIEELEPQVKQAVLDLNKKGYSTDVSGFTDNCGDQMIAGDFQLDEQSVKRLQAMDVFVELNSSGYTKLQFAPKSASVSKIKKEWNEIASIFPNKHQIADASMTKKAREFRKKY